MTKKERNIIKTKFKELEDTYISAKASKHDTIALCQAHAMIALEEIYAEILGISYDDAALELRETNE